MSDKIHPGVMFLQDGTRLPASITLQTEPFTSGWSDITGSTSTQLRKEVEQAGWNFFYMAGEIHVNGFGMSEQSRMKNAMAHLIQEVKLRHCNCLEITGMKHKSFLGLPYTSVSAHARQIQKDQIMMAQVVAQREG